METAALQQDEQQLVVFNLATETYGVDIGAVREIIRLQDITRVPNTPEFVEGVINLRGKVIPVIDLRKRFALPIQSETKDNRIMVVDIGAQYIGVVVDAVTEVLRISPEAIEPPDSIITAADSEYLLGIAKLDDRMIILLDLQQALCEPERSSILEMPAAKLAPGGKSDAGASASTKSEEPGLDGELPAQGGVETRLAQAESAEHDGVVPGADGLGHSGLAERVSEYLSVEEFVPPPGQGVLAAEMRADDYRMGELMAGVDHSPGRSAATPEGAFLESLGGGCRLPVEAQPLDTIWEIPDVLWEKVEPMILKGDSPKATGRKRVNPRPVLNGIIFRLRSGCQWNHLPKTFGDDSTIHRTFKRWVESGILNQVSSVMVEECEELGGVDWEGQATDCAMGKARLGGTRLAPTPRTEAMLAENEACR